MFKKIQIEKEVVVCEVCQKELEGHYNIFKCLHCERTYCLFHSYNHGITYPGCNLSGYIPDGFFCNTCDKQLMLTDDPQYVFYQKMQQFADQFKKFEEQLNILRNEYHAGAIKN